MPLRVVPLHLWNWVSEGCVRFPVYTSPIYLNLFNSSVIYVASLFSLRRTSTSLALPPLLYGTPLCSLSRARGAPTCYPYLTYRPYCTFRRPVSPISPARRLRHMGGAVGLLPRCHVSGATVCLLLPHRPVFYRPWPMQAPQLPCRASQLLHSARPFMTAPCASGAWSTSW